MRTHILIALIALVVSACASKQHLTAGQQERENQRQEEQTNVEYSRVDGSAASRIR